MDYGKDCGGVKYFSGEHECREYVQVDGEHQGLVPADNNLYEHEDSPLVILGTICSGFY